MRVTQERDLLRHCLADRDRRIAELEKLHPCPCCGVIGADYHREDCWLMHCNLARLDADERSDRYRDVLRQVVRLGELDVGPALLASIARDALNAEDEGEE